MTENNRLLILDDEPDVIATYRAMLSTNPTASSALQSSRSSNAKLQAVAAAPLPFQVTYVNTGNDAIEAVKKNLKAGTPYVGGFFDVKLGPGIDGIETVYRIKQIDPSFRCVLVTAYQDRSVEEIRKLFGEDFSANWEIMTKPFFRLEILQKAFNLCANWNEQVRVKERIKILNSSTEKQRQMLDELIGMINLKVIGKAEFALNKTDPEEIKTVIRSLLTDATQLRAAAAKLSQLDKAA